MRNRWGVEIKRGYYAWANWGNKNTPVEGTITEIDKTSDYAKAYGPGVKLEFPGGSIIVSPDAISQVLPPMRVLKGGIVKANPLSRVKLNSPAQRPAGAGKVPAKGSRLYKRRQKTKKAEPGVYANPRKLPALVQFAEVPDYHDGQFSFGVDAVTPVEFVFSPREHKNRNIYVSYKLPAKLIASAEFQSWAAQNPRVILSLNQLRAKLKKFVE